MIELIKSERKILLYLATNGPAFGGQISKNTGLSSRTVSTAPRSLEKKGLVSHIITQESRAKKEYHLTVLGLATALLYPQVNENLSDVVKSWNPLLPLVLGKWDVFIRAKVEDLAWHRLMNAAVVLVRASVSLEWEFAWATPIDPDEIFRSNFYHSPEYDRFASEKRLRWIEVCARDPEVRRYLTGKLMGIIVKHDILKHEAEVMLEALGDELGFLSTPF